MSMKIASEDLELIASHTAALWHQLRGQRIFITGGTGFFGCWLVESFCYMNRNLGLDARAVVLSRNPEAFARKCPHLAADSAVLMHAGDVRNFTYPDGEFGFVIHAATEASAKQAAEEPLEMLSTMIAGTERALQFAAARGARKFLLTSSGAVYGKQPPGMTHVPEDYAGSPNPLEANSVYGEGKRTSELLACLISRSTGLECKIARCWAFCGPHLPLDQHFAIGNFIGDVLARRPIHIQGDGTPRRSYLYAADLVIWLWNLLFNGPSLVPFNVGSEHDVSILELARTVAATLDPNTEILVAHEPVPGASPSRYVPDTSRARDQLGLRETIGLEECIRRTARWHEASF